MLPHTTLRPVTAADWPMLRAWLRLPEIVAWWGPASAAEAEITLAMGSASALCRIIEADGSAIGYAHAVDAALWDDGLPVELPPGTWDLDLFIASADHRGQGYGGEAVRLLIDEVFSTTLAVAVSVFASIRNERAVRAYERAGFRWRRIRHDAVAGPEWMMLLERPARPSG
jgi:aminoglycoside 6'-N-acetyltransferase